MQAAERYCSGTSHADYSSLHTGATFTFPPTFRVGAFLFAVVLYRLHLPQICNQARLAYVSVPSSFVPRRVHADTDEAVGQHHAVSCSVLMPYPR